MNTMRQGAQAYQATAEFRSPREQEADIFRRATGALRSTAAADPVASAMDRVRAIADNRRLWLTVMDLVRDPANVLPAALRAGIVSVGMAVQREMDKAVPDLGFLISVNENMTEGLAGPA